MFYPHLPRLYSCLCNPFVLALLAASLDTVLTFPGISVADILVRSGQVSDEARGLPRTQLTTWLLQAWQNGVMFSIVDSYIYGNKVYTILTLWVLPSWLLLHLNIATGPITDTEEAFLVPSQWTKKQQ